MSNWSRRKRIVAALMPLLVLSCRRGARIESSQETPPFTREGMRISVPQQSPLHDRIVVEAVHREPVRSKLSAPASLEADPSRTAKITPPLAGRVTALTVKLGVPVAKGQPLLAIDSPDFAQAQSDYVRALAQLQQAEKTMARQKDLEAHGIAARRELEQAETDRATAKAEVERSRTRLKNLGSDPASLGKPLVVRSPIAGRVIDLAVAPGEFKNDPNAVLMTIADLSTIWLTANVQEKDLSRVHQGDEAEATFNAYPGETFKGRILFIGDLLDPDTRTVKVRVAFQNQATRLKPGMYANVTFTSAPIPEIVVPSTALLLDRSQSYVFVENSPGSYEKRIVATGEQQGPMTIISNGLSDGDRVVAKDAVLLQ